MSVMADWYRMADLEKETGLSARTIRYYISQHLIPPPETRGRDARYSQEHLDQLRRIQELKEAGKTLQEIRGMLHPEVDQERSFQVRQLILRTLSQEVQDTWIEFQPHPDVRVYARADTTPERQELLKIAFDILSGKESP